MSMFKQISPKQIVQNNEYNFVNQDQLNNINNIPNIETSVVAISSQVAASDVHLINEYLLIQDGKVTLTYFPVDNKIVFDMYMIVERKDDITIIHQEINKVVITDRVIDLGTSFFNGFEVLVSYIFQGKLNLEGSV